MRRGWKPYVKITREEELRRKRERRHVSAYGITVADRERMLEEQGNVCAICGGPPTGNRWDTFVIDHDHISGKVRGLLCSNCNVAIGLLNDDPKLIERAMEYLLRAKEKKV